MSSLWATLNTPLMLRALLEVVLVGSIAGATGVHVVLRRQSFFTLAVSHATFPGVVIASMVGVSIFLGGLLFGLIFSLGVHLLSQQRAVNDTGVIGTLLAGSFAVGVLLQSGRTGGSKDLTAFLVGSVLTVTRYDIGLTIVAGSVIVTLMALLHKELIFTAFDRESSQAMGYGRKLDLVVLLLASSTLVVTIPAVGTVLSVAFISVPAVTARLWSDRVGVCLFLSPVFGAVSGVCGLLVSTQWRVAAGGAIALSCSGLFALSWILTRQWRTSSNPIASNLSEVR
jgi:ABC-type Mn2+/Zn2+ transport system permease subunit